MEYIILFYDTSATGAGGYTRVLVPEDIDITRALDARGPILINSVFAVAPRPVRWQGVRPRSILEHLSRFNTSCLASPL